MRAEGSSSAALSYPPVRVYTLGRFQVEVDGAPLRFGRKAQRRPLDLLKLLIAYGGEGVSAEQIAEDLWPDAEGDAALAALRTTLSRLRRLIGARAVLGDVRGLTLNQEACWVDMLALQQRLADANGAPLAHTALEDVLSLYRGEFLPGESYLPPVLSARARLQRLLLRRFAEFGQQFEQAGQTARAIDLYRRCLEIDGGAEDLARRLERLCAKPSASGGAQLILAVLPFEDLSPRGDHSWFAEAIRETVISLLSTLPHLSVITLLKPGTDSPVRYLVQGSVMASADRLRAAVHLIDARTGQYAWSEHLDHGTGDIISVQDEVAIEIAEGLAEKLVFGEVGKLVLSPDVHLWKALGQARVLVDGQTRQGLQRARAIIGRMLETGHQEAVIEGLQAATYAVAAWKSWVANPQAALRTIELKFRRLRKRYGASALGLNALPWVCALRGDIDEAVRFGRGGVERLPENFYSHAFLGLPLAYQGRYAQALGKIDDAFRAHPQPVHWLYKDRAAIQFCMGSYDEAAGDLTRLFESEYPVHRDADLLSARLMYVASLAAAGRMEQARHEATAALATDPTVSARAWSRWHFQPYRDDGIAPRMERLLVDAGVRL
jgi:TolB-like protein